VKKRRKTLIRILAVTADYNIVKDITLEELSHSKFLWYWVDFNSPTEEETHFLESHFRFHPLAIEDCLHYLQRPKLDYYDGYNFFVLQELNPRTLRAQEIDVFLSNEFIVTFHKQPSNEVDKSWEKMMSQAAKQKVNPASAFHLLMDKIVDQYFPTVFLIEEQLEEIENRESRPTKALMNEVFDIRGDLLRLRRIIFPMRDLLYRLLNSERIEISAERKVYFGDIYDHLLKLADIIESNRDVTSDIRDSYISLNSDRMNNVMMTLTVISSIFIPLTFIVGVYGMNFEYMPELTWHYGYYMVLCFMTIIGFGMFGWFKRKGWIGDKK
jgi:magnesium transporter